LLTFANNVIGNLSVLVPLIWIHDPRSFYLEHLRVKSLNLKNHDCSTQILIYSMSL